MKNIAKQYIKDIRKEFSTFYHSERRFLKDFKISVDEFTQNRPYTYDSLVRRFGTPAEIIENYYYFRNEDQIIKHSKYSFRFLIVIGILCLLVTISTIVYVFSKEQEFAVATTNCDGGHYEDQIKITTMNEEH